MWTYTNDWTDAAFARWVAGWRALGGDPAGALAVCFSESRCYASEHNPGGAVGINQLEPDNFHAVGWEGDAEGYAALPAEEQISYVLNYFAPHAHDPELKTIAGIYVVNFLPVWADKAGDPNFVLCGKSGPYANFYASNWRVFDPAGTGIITPSMLAAHVAKVAMGARWTELRTRLEIALEGSAPSPDPAIAVKDVQQALTDEGYPTTVDGIAGPATAHAISRFEAAHNLPIDGAITVMLAAALARALRAHAVRLNALATELEPEPSEHP